MFTELMSVLTMFLVYLSLLLAVLWMWFQWSHRDLLRAAAKVPVTRRTVPLLGHAYSIFWGLEESSRRMLEMTVGAVDKGIRTVCIWNGPFPFIFLGDVNDIQIILNGVNGTTKKSEDYDHTFDGLESGGGPFGENILSARGQSWKVRKKHLNLMFHRHNIQYLMPVFNRNSRELMVRMSKHVGKGPFNVMEYTMDLGLKTICNLVFGPEVHIDVESEYFKSMIRLVERIPDLFLKKYICPWLWVGWLFRLLYSKELKQMNTTMENFFKTTLKAAKEKRTPKSCLENLNESYDGLSTNENQGLLNLLDAYQPLRQKYPEFTEADMRCEMVALYCTGTDTIGSSTASCLLALAQYQDIQERLYKEIISVVDTECDVTLEDVAKMPYLDQVVKETLRRFIIVPFVSRMVTKEVKLSNCTLPVGSRAVCNIGAVHMDPEIYKNPQKFDPDRFSPENSRRNESFSFIPFSGGPIMCIGKTYAMQLMKIEIIHVLRKFRLTTKQDINNLKNKLVITFVSSEGYNICVEKRTLDKRVVGSD